MYITYIHTYIRKPNNKRQPQTPALIQKAKWKRLSLLCWSGMQHRVLARMYICRIYVCDSLSSLFPSPRTSMSPSPHARTYTYVHVYIVIKPPSSLCSKLNMTSGAVSLIVIIILMFIKIKSTLDLT
ncbi:unnamed protein product [Ceratitis capitata]|uniref:(Mediterranean fruit fly) hypothetical protein n=1 Tax=Ceratitis capitata TaxID=7213 RepID=A0A811UIF0_CERCA|nr:unnamed protein product [Ceratitis capitata]